jgi:DNA invertase Pin-like site-specific DNA recombinase
VVKKKAAKKKSASKKGGGKKPPRRADRSRIDLNPLKDQIRRRIKDLEQGGGKAVGTAGTPEETVKRLKDVLETLAEICHPTMDVAI